MNGYPHTESFLRFAAANCGVPAIPEEGHEAVSAGSELTLKVYDPPRYMPPERKLRSIRVQVDVVRAGELAVGRACADRPFEGTVIKSSHKEIKRGDEVIGLVSRDCEALLVDTANVADMKHLTDTFGLSQYRDQIIL